MTGIAILGFGTVGSGVYNVIEKNHDHIMANTGLDLKVVRICDIKDIDGEPGKIATKDFEDLLKDPRVEIIVETMGGLHPAREFSEMALDAGKSVVTSNKELVADCGGVFLRKAKELGLNYMFEASVGGGIPVIRSIMNSLVGEDITSAKGILNGTTNYILTKMSEEGVEYKDALTEAQRLGYAEKDPTDDVEGIDACRKIAIIASLIYQKAVDPEDIYTEGISSLTKTDLEYASKLKATIKLLAKFRKTDEGVAMMVCPFVIKRGTPLYGVNGVYNAVTVNGTMMGEIMYYGKGAGMYPTASAVVADVIREAQHFGKDISPGWTADKMKLIDICEEVRFFLVRTGKEDEDLVKELFGDVKIVHLEDRPEEIGFFTPEYKEKDFMELYNRLSCPVKFIRGDIDADS